MRGSHAALAQREYISQFSVPFLHYTEKINADR